MRLFRKLDRLYSASLLVKFLMLVLIFVLLSCMNVLIVIDARYHPQLAGMLSIGFSFCSCALVARDSVALPYQNVQIYFRKSR